MRRTLGVGLAAALLLALMALPAAAQDAYPPAAPECTLATGGAGGDDVAVDGDDVAVNGLGGPAVGGEVEPGGTVVVSCAGWAPNTEVTATLFSTPVVLGTTVTDAQGRLTQGFTIPAGTAPGAHTLRMSGLDAQNQPASVDLSLTVAGLVTPPDPPDPSVTPPDPAVTPPDPAAPAPRLPRTGGDAWLAMAFAAGLLAAGGGALGAARRRNQADSSA